MDRWLERALEAEEELEAANERIEDLTARIKSALNAEPESASRALSWIGRAQNAEKLLAEVLIKVNEARNRTVFEGSFIARIEAQLKTVEILKRDQEALGESSPNEEWWETARDSDGRSWLRTSKQGP